MVLFFATERDQQLAVIESRMRGLGYSEQRIQVSAAAASY
jgi:hypothetical protein